MWSKTWRTSCKSGISVHMNLVIVWQQSARRIAESIANTRQPADRPARNPCASVATGIAQAGRRTFREIEMGNRSDALADPLAHLGFPSESLDYRPARNALLAEELALRQDSRHNDALDPMWNLFDLTPEGRGSFHPKLAYQTPRCKVTAMRHSFRAPAVASSGAGNDRCSRWDNARDNPGAQARLPRSLRPQ